MPTRDSSPRAARPVALFVISCAANLALVACQGTATPPSPDTAETAARPSTEDRSEDVTDSPESRLQRLLERSWWREAEPVEALQLSEAQQQSLDTLFESTWHRQRALRDEAEQLQSRFAEALEQGDVDAARGQAEAIAESSAALARAELTLRMEGIAVLTEPQRASLRDRYPHLLSRPWLRFRAPRGSR